MAGVTWRFLNTRFENAFFNMAADEAVLESVREGGSPPVFRAFGWQPPGLSFGYAQRVGREVDLDQCREMGVEVVRRPTGGRAVLHWNELTYSVLCRGDDPLVGGGVLEAYRRISECLVAGLRRFGVAADLVRTEPPSVRPVGESITSPCFSSAARHEVVIGGRKLIGSAQRRMGDMLLQHGSLILGPEHRRIVDLLRLTSDEMKAQFRRELDEGTTSLEEALGRPAAFDDLAECLRRGFEETLRVPFVEQPLTGRERERIEILVREKYGTEAWNFEVHRKVIR
jgi:lipoate-protein ligase A